MPELLASELASIVDGELVGPDSLLTGVCSINNPSSGRVGYLTDPHSSSVAHLPPGSVFLVSEAPVSDVAASFIVVANPRLAFAQASQEFVEINQEPHVHPLALVHPSASLHSSVRVGAFCVIEDSCDLAENVVIDHGTIIKRKTKIGRHSTIGSNSTIGSVGFGLENDSEGVPRRIAHHGIVEIGEGVEIGSQVVIARGTTDSTTIHDNVRIDDHVFIAHNVEIGSRSLVIAGSEVSGSVKIGMDCWIAPQATIKQKVVIGDRAMVGLGAVVVRDVPPGVIVVGNPARVVRKR